jgi:hypothetical protein
MTAVPPILRGMTSSIDRAEWHYAGDFPRDLPPECGGTHIGMYLAWIVQRNLGSATLRKYARDSLPLLQARKITGRELLFTELDEKFFETLLSKEGRGFTRDYYESGCYIDDYDEVLGGSLPTIYHVADSWTNYDKLAPVIDDRFTRWQQGTGPLPGNLQAQVKLLEEEYLDTILAVAGKLPADPQAALAIFHEYLAREPLPAFRTRVVREIERLRVKYRLDH